MNRIFDVLLREDKIKRMIEALKSGEHVNLSNVRTGLKGFLSLLAYDALPERSLLFLTHSDREAKRRAEVMQKFHGEKILYYPLEPVHDYYADAHSKEITYQRVSTIEKLFNGGHHIVIASIDAILKKLLPLEDMKKRFFSVSVGEIIEVEALIDKLINLGYERVYQVEAKGQFALRGGILDIGLVTEEEGVRIEFFDDEVDTLRRFALESQLSFEQMDTAKIAPAGEITLDEKSRDTILKRIIKAYGDNPLYQETLERYTQNPIEQSEAFFTFSNKNTTFLDYLGDCIVFLDEYSLIRDTSKIYTDKVWADYEALNASGYVLPEEKEKIYSFARIERELNQRPTVKMNLFSNRFRKGVSLDVNSRDLESFVNRFNMFLKFLQNRLEKEYTIFIQCKNKSSKDKLKQLLIDNDIIEFADDMTAPGIHFSYEEISEGFEIPDAKILYVNESEIFREREGRRRRHTQKGKKIDAFTELHVGDHVVHDIHGIGIYRGIEQMEIGDLTKDLMIIEYAGDDRLYLPIEQMDAVQVYVGTGGDHKPKINKIGNPDWQKAKTKAKKAVEDMADELIALYSKRREMKGYAFGLDTPWQKEFEDDFPYTETDDQLRCVDEIKTDMESDIPMDRLLCGDVGYGKTEVALRAAFKAIMDGRQCAILVPTTILAQQHYNTCIGRFAKYPIKVEVISRFRTPTQQKKILSDLAVGKIDLIIGTHRLLSKDIKFKDLRLLIIDEEQRFGVKSKEKIKQLRKNIDVLTLSATPIPRTLHMSMTGIRDMSIIEEPPEGRRPVQTYVMAYNPLIVKDAIDREMARSGQVYFVHNRVRDIKEVAASVQRLAPEARIAVVHGQMAASELENIMVDFLDYHYDILITTTIIESGLDVKNANTLIVDNGDHFGLSQLYQIRGRVGRSDIQAYAYVTHRREYLSEVAQKRLKAIKDFTAFGSGFKVAMRDLEIRGAGNILGAEQSGHLFKIGYELYCRILEQAVKAKLEGTEPESEEPIQIHLDVNAFIPDQYIESEEAKYDIYKKLTYIRNYEDYDELETELIDRFGEVPSGVYNLMAIAMIKNMAASMGVIEIKQQRTRMLITFADEKKITLPESDKVAEMISLYNIRFNAGRGSKPCWSIDITDSEDHRLLKRLTDFFIMF